MVERRLTQFPPRMPHRQINDFQAFGAHAPRGALARIIGAARSAPEGWAGRRAAYFLRALGIRALRGKPADVETLGARMRLYPADNVSEKRMLFTPQYFDRPELDYLAQRITPDFVFVDVGANVGGYSLFVAARAGAAARILAIEPQPEIHERLVYNVRQNDFATVKTLECAAADCDGEVTMFLDARNRGDSSIRIVPSHDGGRLTVRARKLADILAGEGLDRIDAMKLDCEGAEDLILEPFLRDGPGRLRPKTMIVEHMPERWSIDLPAFIEAQGYRATLRTKHNLVYERQEMEVA
ncbi:MAG: FkbM family methyltransferase [Rhodoblastus sp.]